MKKTRTVHRTTKNASKMHRHIGSLLQDPLFNKFTIRQEYPVYKINPDFKSKREKFDWVMLGLYVVIEVHGKQHYEPVRFGGIDINKAKQNLRKQNERDRSKTNAALEVGWTYLVIKYDEDNIDADNLMDKILLAQHKGLEDMEDK